MEVKVISNFPSFIQNTDLRIEGIMPVSYNNTYKNLTFFSIT